MQTADGMRMELHETSEVLDKKTGATLAFLKLSPEGTVHLLWSPIMFSRAVPMPEDLRATVVKLLRFHADKLESRDLDKRMHAVQPDPLAGGAA
jgi:hypothetical protein